MYPQETLSGSDLQRPLLPPSSACEDPMQVERLKPSVEERHCRNTNNLCFYSWAKIISYVGKLQHLGFYSSQCISVPAILTYSFGFCFTLQVFVDFGSSGNFIHSSLVSKYSLPITYLEKPLSISSINGEVLAESIFFSKHWGKQCCFSCIPLLKPTKPLATVLLGLPIYYSDDKMRPYCHRNHTIAL